MQRVQQDDAGRSLSLQESPNSYRERETRRKQLRASREQHAVRTDSPKLETKQGKSDRQTDRPHTRQPDKTQHRDTLACDANRILYRTPSLHRSDPRPLRI